MLFLLFTKDSHNRQPNYAYICVVHVATHYVNYIAHKWYV